MAEVENVLFRDLLSRGETVYGIFAKTCDPLILEALGTAGYDFVILDLEHGPNSTRELYTLVLAAQNAGMYPIVRVGSLSAIAIERVLDIGVAGIQVPQIGTMEAAQMVVSYSRFHPGGERGLCRYVRPARFSQLPKEEYLEQQNKVSIIVQVEGTLGAQNIDQIANVDSIDVIFLGPYDLSQSLGFPGEVERPEVVRVIESVVRTCEDAGKCVGIFTDTPEAIRRYKAMGIRYIAHGVDVGLVAAGARSAVELLHNS